MLWKQNKSKKERKQIFLSFFYYFILFGIFNAVLRETEKKNTKNRRVNIIAANTPMILTCKDFCFFKL